MKYIYLAGPIAGCTEWEANDWRVTVASRITSGVVPISPLRCEPAGKDGTYDLPGSEATLCPKFGTGRAIFAKNYLDVQSCDAVLAFFPWTSKGVSIGTLLEVGWAKALSKPVILVSRDPRITAHPVLDACAAWKLETLEEAVEVINGVFGGYVGGKNV